MGGEILKKELGYYHHDAKNKKKKKEKEKVRYEEEEAIPRNWAKFEYLANQGTSQ